MQTLKGPGIFLAQFMGDVAPFNNLQSICLWAEALGFKGVQLPTWDSRCIDLQKAAESKTYADELKGIINDTGLQITELSTHLQGQLVAFILLIALRDFTRRCVIRPDRVNEQLKWAARL
jgi:sugar phosphate isomerase/epimerase